MVSTKCTISRAETTRDSRNAICECFWYQRARKYIGTPAASTSSPLRQSRANTVMAVKNMNRVPDASELTPESRRSRSASRSEVCRAMMRPEVYFSWNSRLSRWVCRKTRDAQVQQHRLAQARRRGHVHGGESRRRDRRGEVRDAGEHERDAVTGAQGRQGVVDPEGDQRRAGDAGGLGQHDRGDGQPEAQADRPDQRTEQRQGAAPDRLAVGLGQVCVVLVGGAEGSCTHRRDLLGLECGQLGVQVPGLRIQAGDDVAVVAVLREQFGVGADGGDPSVLQQGHPVGQGHGGGPVGDDQGGGVREHLAQAWPRRVPRC